MRALYRPKSFVVAIEGIIGAGKTTLTNHLAHEIGLREVHEPVQENPYLDDFYRDQKTWAFPMQMWMVTQRAAALADACAEHSLIITDRSLVGDMAFARMHKRNGNIDKAMWPIYRQFWHTASRLIAPPPDMILFLDVKPSVALERIKERGRKSEVNGVSLEYLQNLTATYRDVIDNLGRISKGTEAYMGTRIEELRGTTSNELIVSWVREHIKNRMSTDDRKDAEPNAK